MRVYGTVNLTALRHNLAIVRKFALNSRVMGVIKSNAYGHGAIRVANTLESSVDAFAVATVDEAVELREAKITAPICVLSGFHELSQLDAIFDNQLQVVIFCKEQIDLLCGYHSKGQISVWLKVNTGMNRLGFYPDQVEDPLKCLELLENVSTIRLMSHFASADDRNSDTTQEQAKIFDKLTLELESRHGKFEKSIANSAGVIDYPNSHLDWVRPGIMLYGVSPILDVSATELNLRPVMNVYARLIAVNMVRTGHAVGYGGEWISQKDTAIGILGCGYGDGYHRSMSPNAKVLIHERPAPIVGRVSMDTLAVDLSNHQGVQVGTEVKLFGDGLPVEEQAASAGTIGYELLTSIAGRQMTLQTIS